MDSPTKLQLLPLHTHTSYSFLDGASDISEYLDWCKKVGAHALGVTDHGYMAGVLELIQKAQACDVIPLPGCEFYVVPEKEYEFKGKPYDYYHVTAWAVNEVGYKNLLKLGSISFNDEDINQWYYDSDSKKNVYGPKKRVAVKVRQAKPRITFSELFQYHEGLVIGSGCLIGSINKSLLEGEYKGAEENLLRLLNVFKGRLFIELMPHHCTHNWKKKQFVHNECNEFSPDGDLQKACNYRNIEISKKYDLPLLMTTDSHFVYPQAKAVQDILLGNGEENGWRFYNSYHAMTVEDAWEHWRNTYGNDADQRRIFAEGIESGHHIASLARGLRIQNSFHQPKINLPADIQTIQNEKDQLKTLIIRKINEHGRMKWDDSKWSERLAKELRIICDNGIIDFSNYFMFLEHWAQWTRDHSILSAPGRGSAAGCLLAYLLKITHLNPMPEAHNLPFERFLSMGRLKRGKFPDIDWDLSARDLLTAKLGEHYGDKFAQCSTHGTLKIKSAIKDVCRVLWKLSDLDPETRKKKLEFVNEITKTIPMTPTGVSDRDFLLGYTDSEGIIHQGVMETNPTLNAFFTLNPKAYEMVLKLLGIPRSVGRHASSFFIADEAIQNIVPTCNINGYVCTQYTSQPSEKSGLIKFDFLRVNTLMDISVCIRLVQKRLGYNVNRKVMTIGQEEFDTWEGDIPVEILPMADGRKLDIYNLPDEEEVYLNFDAGKTESVFQMSTSLLTGFCKRVKPRCLADLGALVALVRPGPLVATIEDGETTMTEAYIKRRHKQMPITYAHPDLEPILKETFGVVVYQEQLQQIFSDLAGYSPEEADQIRELIAKKKKQDMEKTLPEIRSRLKAKGWNENQIQVLVDLCIASASYSFNKSHSASYATVAYQCMYLKHHYPLEWWTAVLSNAKVEDIREKGYAEAVNDILVLPHVNGPMDTFELIDGKIHAPLYLINRIGKTSCAPIKKERDKNGPFVSFQDFYERIDKEAVDKTVFHNMILCDAFKFISDAKPNELIEQYHFFRRVEGLKIGRGKIGEELAKAVVEFKESGGKCDVPELYQDDLELEVSRLSLLPIYKVDCHTKFRNTLRKCKFQYDSSGVVTSWANNRSVTILRNGKDIFPFFSRSNYPFCGWVGLIQSEEEFSYEDKKTRQNVKALKVFVNNDGDSLECVLWPNVYQVLGKPDRKKIIYAKGIIKEGRDPGKWQMFVQDISQI